MTSSVRVRRVYDDPEPADGARVLDAGLAEGDAGDAACWANLVCPQCGAVVTEGHRPGCQAGAPG